MPAPDATVEAEFAKPPPDQPAPPPVMGTATIHGVLRRGGRPAQGFTINLYRSDSNSQDRRSVTTNARGEYVFHHVPAGKWMIDPDVQWRPQWGPGPREEIDVADNAQLNHDFDVPGPDPGHGPKPYGAPPARRRIV